MFTGKKQEELSEIKEIKIPSQIETIVASFYANWDYPCIQNLEFRNKKGQYIGNTGIS